MERKVGQSLTQREGRSLVNTHCSDFQRQGENLAGPTVCPSALGVRGWESLLLHVERNPSRPLRRVWMVTSILWGSSPVNLFTGLRDVSGLSC